MQCNDSHNVEATKEKITRLHHLEEQWIFLDDEHDMTEGEELVPISPHLSTQTAR